MQKSSKKVDLSAFLKSDRYVYREREFICLKQTIFLTENISHLIQISSYPAAHKY